MEQPPLPVYRNTNRFDKPKTSWQKFLSVCYWIFPPTFLLGCLKFVFSKLFGRLIGSFILPAIRTQIKGSKEEIKYKADREKFEIELKSGKDLFSKLMIEERTVITPDGAELDTLMISPQKRYQNINDHAYIIAFNGNSEYFESTDENDQHYLLRKATDKVKSKHCQYILFNHRGVGKSTAEPKSSEDLISDILSQANYLIEQGVDSENIYFDGFSLGAASATITAARLHAFKHKVIVYNARSFAKLSDVIPDYYSGPLKIILKIIIKSILFLTDWEMDAGSAMHEIPESHRDYYCVRSSKSMRHSNTESLKKFKGSQKERLAETLFDDELIPHSASIHAAFKEDRRQFKKELIDSHQYDHHTINTRTKESSNRHKMSIPLGVRGHDAAPQILQWRYGEDPNRDWHYNANDHFNVFFKRTRNRYQQKRAQAEQQLPKLREL